MAETILKWGWILALCKITFTTFPGGLKIGVQFGLIWTIFSTFFGRQGAPLSDFGPKLDFCDIKTLQKSANIGSYQGQIDSIRLNNQGYLAIFGNFGYFLAIFENVHFAKFGYFKLGNSPELKLCLWLSQEQSWLFFTLLILYLLQYIGGSVLLLSKCKLTVVSQTCAAWELGSIPLTCNWLRIEWGSFFSMTPPDWPLRTAPKGPFHKATVTRLGRRPGWFGGEGGGREGGGTNRVPEGNPYLYLYPFFFGYGRLDFV